jgi:limonene-1,2-epoxide hydrolase
MSEKLQILKRVIAAWTDGDIEGALAHMHEDIVWHYAAAVAPPARGKAKARKFLEGFKAQITEVRWRLFDHAETANRLFVEGVDEYVARDGAVVRAPYAGVLDFDGDLITGWRDYVDVGLMEAQKTGAAASPWLMALIDREAI